MTFFNTLTACALAALVACGPHVTSQPLVVPDDTAWKTWATWDADDYAITNELLRKAGSGKPIAHGGVQSSDNVWFCDAARREVLIVGLYTDLHRTRFIHFATTQVPDVLLREVEFNNARFDIASPAEVKPHLKAFVADATPLVARPFATRLGLRLGAALDKAKDLYGAPDSSYLLEGYRVLEWRYAGDAFLTAAPAKGTRVARDSYGHTARVYGKEGRVVGIGLFNAVP